MLGSGFSAGMGLPTLLGLFAELMDQQNRPGYSDKEEVLNALELLYPHFLKDVSPPSYPPFEEFLSLVTAAKELPFFDPSDLYWENKRLAALRLLTDAMGRKCRETEKASLLKHFVNKLQQDDVIVTFNWDNLIERILYTSSLPFNFQGRSENSIAILKLHGSLNWVEIPEGVALQDPKSVLHLDARIVCTRDYGYYDVWDVLNLPPYIILPISSKQVPVGEFLKSIWMEAFSAIIDAQCVVVIGYSIPTDDLQARSLLSLAWKARVRKRQADQQQPDKLILIDPNPDVCGRYASEITSELMYFQSYFDERILAVLFEN